MAEPLAPLSPSRQNSRNTPLAHDKGMSFPKQMYLDDSIMLYSPSPKKSSDSLPPPQCPPSPPDEITDPTRSPKKAFSPVKYRLQDETQMTMSPPGSPVEPTIRFNEGLTQVCNSTEPYPTLSPMMSASSSGTPDLHFDGNRNMRNESPRNAGVDGVDLTLNIEEKAVYDETLGDLSSISAIPADMTRFADLLKSPSKTARPTSWSPSKQLRGSISAGTPGTAQRPLRLLSGSRHSSSSNEDEEATPRQQKTNNDTIDLLNFTGTTNIVIPPPSASRTSRRSPSGRAFPIRINPSPAHKSQASVDRERAGGRNGPQQSYFPDRSVSATPSTHRHSVQLGTGYGDLLDIDLEPMTTPRSIPSVTPRELETLRSELQSRISGLEATLSGKEAEVMALKRAVTDAEVRVGKTSEDLRTERAAREEAERHQEEVERRGREMENMLRDLKQNAFMEEREREKLRRQAEDAEHRVEDHEVKILELTASLDTLRATRFRSSAGFENSPNANTPGWSSDIDSAVKSATEKVARELHVLYKGKHERKVSDLKVSYEKRWIKQVDQLKSELKMAQEEIQRLQNDHASMPNGAVLGQTEAISKMEGQVEELRRWNEEINTNKKALEAEVSTFKEQLSTANSEIETLRRNIEQERSEKGELVAQVDLFLSMSAQQETAAPVSPPQNQPVSPPRSEDGRPGSSAAARSPSKFRNSLSGAPASMPTPTQSGSAANGGGRSRPLSMLQRPAGGKFSGIPAPGSGLKPPGGINGGNVARNMGYGGRSGGIMENIARMGAGGR